MEKPIAVLIIMFAFTFAHAQQPQAAPAAGANPALSAQQQLQQAQAQQSLVTQFPESDAVANSSLTYKIIDAPNNTFGYDVFVDGRLMIHQTSIPAMPGNEGFKTKDDATKVAEMVVNKIRKGEMPPTVSPEEMKAIGLIK